MDDMLLLDPYQQESHLKFESNPLNLRSQNLNKTCRLQNVKYFVRV